MATACIPDQEPTDQIAGHDCIVAGWGDTLANPSNPDDTLLKATVRVMEDEKCKRLNNMPDGILCTEKADHYACSRYGDSGGPLNCLINQRWYVYGVISFGKSAICDDDSVDMYARTSYFSKWIWDTIERDA